MIFLQKRRYKKHKGVIVKGFSYPGTNHGYNPIPLGEIVGYGKGQLVVKCLNVVGWASEECKIYHKIDSFKEFNQMGYWFVSLKEVEDSILMEKKNERMDQLIESKDIKL